MPLRWVWSEEEQWLNRPSFARSLGRSASRTTLAEAAPRMLAAVCEALGWEYGALWEVDRDGKTLQCVGTWHTSSLEVTEFVEHQSNDQVRARRRSAGTGLGVGPARLDSGRRRRLRIFRVRRRRTASACTARSRCRSCAAATCWA